MNQTIDQENPEQIDSRFPLWLAITANLLSLGLTLQFFGLSRNDRIRPIGWVAWILLIGLASAIVVLPLVLFNLKRLRGRRWPIFAVVLSLTPIPLGMAVQGIAHMIIGYHLLE